MSLFETAGADAAYDRWLEPANVHELDDCDGCHDAGEHKNPLDFCDACSGCAERVKDKAEHAAYEFTFTMKDVEKARTWADSHRYVYDSVEHLLLDALRSQIISTDKWIRL
jgi:hypothetical protein